MTEELKSSEEAVKNIKAFGNTIGTMLVTRAFNEVDGRDNTAIDNDIERLKKQMVMLAKIHRMAVEKEND